MANITWDPATAIAVTLSGGNLVATNTGTTATLQGARVADAEGKTTGKYYFEITLTNLGAGGGNRGLGIGTITSTYGNMGGTATTGVMMFPQTGNIWRSGSSASVSLGVRASGNIIGIAVDFNNSQSWMRVAPAGNWNNSGAADPATNTGGVAVPSGSGALVPFCTFGGTSGVAGVSFTANFGDSAFSSAVPTGFTTGWPSVAVATQTVRVMVLA